MRITFNSLEGFTDREIAKLERAKDILLKVINSADYRQAVLNADFSGETSEWATKANKEILEHILSGAEILLPVKDNEVDLSVEAFNPNWFQRNIVGFTYPNTVTQWVSRKYLGLMSDAALAGHLFHEWLHKMGFDHDRLPTAKRRRSVCYVHNEIIEALAKKLNLLHPHHAKQPVKTYKRAGIFTRLFRWFTDLL